MSKVRYGKEKKVVRGGGGCRGGGGSRYSDHQLRRVYQGSFGMKVVFECYFEGDFISVMFEKTNVFPDNGK